MMPQEFADECCSTAMLTRQISESRVAGRQPGYERIAGSLKPAFGYVLAYLLLDWVSYLHPVLPLAITPWNPPPGLSLAFLLLFGLRQWPWLFVAALLAEFLVSQVPSSWAWPVAASAALTFCYAGLALFLRRVVGIGTQLRALRDLSWLIAGCVITAMVAALAYVGVYTMSGIAARGDFLANVLRFWIGDVIGLLVTTPLLLALAAEQPFRWHFTREMLFQVCSLILALWIIFGIEFTDEFKFFYLLFLPVVWISTRHGILGAALALALTQVGLIIALEWGGHNVTMVMEFQMLMLGLTVTGLFLGMTVTVRKNTEERLHQREADLNQAMRLASAGEMSQVIAHELNQPLSALANYARASRAMLKQPAQHGALLASTLEKLDQEATRAGQVVKRLRELFRSGELHLEPLGIATLIEEGVFPARRRAERNGIEIRLKLEEGLPLIHADRVQIGMVMHNLVANAIEALSAGGGVERAVVISAARQGPSRVLICVADTGQGIAPEMADRLFDSFATSKPEGMGLGLTISRTLVEAHGGTLWLESVHPARFCLSLPIQPAEIGACSNG